MNDFIFCVGAPGSRWSNVAKSIYLSESIDRSDHKDSRIYKNPSSKQIMHMGAYFDPGMEFGNELENYKKLSKLSLEKIFNAPFSGNGRRIVKSHFLSLHVESLFNTFRCPTIMVYRYDAHCFDWWKEAGGWNISYPNYSWYKNDNSMRQQIQLQNRSILSYIKKEKLYSVGDNHNLCEILKIKKPKDLIVFTDCDVYCKI